VSGVPEAGFVAAWALPVLTATPSIKQAATVAAIRFMQYDEGRKTALYGLIRELRPKTIRPQGRGCTFALAHGRGKPGTEHGDWMPNR
jgi:hypothetical protein